MMLDEESDFLEEAQQIKTQENVRPTLPISIPILFPQLVDHRTWCKDVTIFFMDIIVEHIVDARWQAFQAQDWKRLEDRIVGQFPREAI